jgi:hypothetical protein
MGTSQTSRWAGAALCTASLLLFSGTPLLTERALANTYAGPENEEQKIHHADVAFVGRLVAVGHLSYWCPVTVIYPSGVLGWIQEILGPSGRWVQGAALMFEVARPVKGNPGARETVIDASACEDPMKGPDSRSVSTQAYWWLANKSVHVYALRRTLEIRTDDSKEARGALLSLRSFDVEEGTR